MKTVLITGASSGLGAEIARAFAKQGAALSLTGRNKENLSKVSKECKDLGAGNVVEIVADLSNKEGIEKVVKETMKVYDKLDVLVNNAGLLIPGSTETQTFQDFNLICNVNLRAPFFLLQMCIPYLENAKGNIVNVSSMMSKLYSSFAITYGLTKAGLDHFTKTAALELSAKGIRVNAVNPGTVRTHIFDNWFAENELKGLFENMDSQTPLGRKNVEAKDVSNAVLFLSSDEAKMITGVCMTVDGCRSLAGIKK